jgi:hypothetical protein
VVPFLARSYGRLGSILQQGLLVSNESVDSMALKSLIKSALI